MLIARVRRSLRERSLLRFGRRLLVAISGGPDSAVLLAVLARLADELGLILHAASVDHGLRPGAAQDVEIARAQAAQLRVPFEALAVQVPPGPSLQAQARSARYAALFALRQRLGADALAVGHTRDDQMETVLMRILRGAGLRGLSGIQPCRADGLIRPLIDCRREQVHAFARAQFGALSDDPSNQDPRFERVRMRTQVLPALLQEDPSLPAHLAELADEAQALADFCDVRARAWLAEQGTRPRRLCFSSHDANAPWFSNVLRLWLQECAEIQVGRAHLAQLQKAVSSPADVWLPGGFRVLADGRGELRLQSPGGDGAPCT